MDRCGHYIDPGAYVFQKLGKPSPQVRTATSQSASPITQDISHFFDGQHLVNGNISPQCYLHRGINGGVNDRSPLSGLPSASEPTTPGHNSPYPNAYSPPNSALSNALLLDSPSVTGSFHTPQSSSASSEGYLTGTTMFSPHESLFGLDPRTLTSINHTTMNPPTYPSHDVPLSAFKATLNSSMAPTIGPSFLIGMQHHHHNYMPTASTSSGHPSLRVQSQTSSASTSPTQDDSPHVPATLIETQPVNSFSQQDQLVDQIRASSWFRNNQSEPEDLPGQSIYLRFLKRISDAGTYLCLYRGCNRTFDRRDRALGHVRQHLNHRPFFCGGKCFNGSCKERFFSAAYLRTHISRSKIQCEHCPAQIFPQNMRRHLKSCRGFKAKLPLR
ncbi:hypothetical protein CPB86DRAFT_145931 [Serendipita vermifera]|nr:hypothetical protein CPB86DRAFT_145931 [Serendipita vermifera]